MRLLGVLTVSLLAATASADSLKLPFEIVNVLPETQQVLVLDRAHNKHVLLAPGATFEDYTVVAIDGIGVIVDKQAERFTVYPRAAQGLALDLYKNKIRPPAIYSTTQPAVPTQVAEETDTDRMYVVLAELATWIQAPLEVAFETGS